MRIKMTGRGCLRGEEGENINKRVKDNQVIRVTVKDSRTNS